jgi:glucans biosynthesis protein
VPGRHSEVRVRSRLFLRERIAMLGIAPLTSMFVHGENDGPCGDFRPEVHDSDGLMVALGDAGNTEWLWRPLLNPQRPLATSFQAKELRGFGLMQRDRAFASYEDLEARYERRPSAWVVPEGDWGPGRVELLQLPTPDESRDNIVAAWVPENLPAPGEPLDLAYRIVWQGDEPERPPNAWAVQSRAGHGMTPLGPGEFQYVIDFAGPALDALPDEVEIEAVVTVGANARLLERNAYRNDVRGGWRMTVRVQRLHPAQPVELRAYLRQQQNALTETWTHVIPAD